MGNRYKKPESNLVYGRRAVLELLESDCKIIELHLASSDTTGEPIGTIIRLSDKHGIDVKKTDRQRLDSLTSNGNHQAVAAYYRSTNKLSVNELIHRYGEKKDALIILLDGVQDPQNFGAIIRSSEVLGAGGIVYRHRRAAGITPVVIKASAGAALRFPLSMTENINQAVQLLKQNGFWIFGLDSNGDSDLYKTKLTGKIGLIFGSEGKGISTLTKKRCDALIHIPQLGKIGSLNVSVSAGIALGEWLRQRGL